MIALQSHNLRKFLGYEIPNILNSRFFIRTLVGLLTRLFYFFGKFSSTRFFYKKVVYKKVLLDWPKLKKVCKGFSYKTTRKQSNIRKNLEIKKVLVLEFVENLKKV